MQNRTPRLHIWRFAVGSRTLEVAKLGGADMAFDFFGSIRKIGGAKDRRFLSSDGCPPGRRC